MWMRSDEEKVFPVELKYAKPWTSFFPLFFFFFSFFLFFFGGGEQQCLWKWNSTPLAMCLCSVDDSHEPAVQSFCWKKRCGGLRVTESTAKSPRANMAALRFFIPLKHKTGFQVERERQRDSTGWVARIFQGVTKAFSKPRFSLRLRLVLPSSIFGSSVHFTRCFSIHSTLPGASEPRFGKCP